MKFQTLTAALALAAASMVALAQTPPAPPEGKDGKGDHKGPPMMRDCSKIEDADRKAGCEKRQAAFKAAQEKCKDKAEGEARRTCMRENLPKPPEKK